MKKYIGHLILLFSFVMLFSCQSEFEFESSNGQELRFSRDTIYLDTVFSTIGSSTYTLKVYNTSDKNIKIPTIQLAKGNESKYRLMIDGMAGKSFENVELLAKDSLFVFVETTVDIKQATSEVEYLYTDEILFRSGSNSQKVALVTLVKDAIFLYPQKFEDGTYETLPINGESVQGFYLDENDAINGNELIWTNAKPYVIYGYAAVPSGKTLGIQAGTQVHFHKNSGLIVSNSATLNIEGTVDNPTVLQGDRLEPSFENIPGQWDMIWYASGSKGSVKNTIVKNATIGLFINNNSEKIELHNLQVYNCSNTGILGRAAKIFGSNVVTNNCGTVGLALTYGGNYEFLHSTFTNYWSRPSHTAVSISNIENGTEYPIEKVRFVNSIIYSGSGESLIMNMSTAQNLFSRSFENCLIKFLDNQQLFFGNYPYDFNNLEVFKNCLIARNSSQYAPHFYNISKNEMMITTNASSLIGVGDQNTTLQVPYDLKGNYRTTSDLGAYVPVEPNE